MPRKTDPAKKAENEFFALVRRTDKENPDPADIKLLKQRIGDFPLFMKANDPAEMVQAKMIQCYTKTSAGLRTILDRRVYERKQELGYDTAPPLERMLIDQLVLAQMRLNYVESWVIEQMGQSVSLAQGEYAEKRLLMCQRRFTRTCEALAKVRKLHAEADYHDARARKARSASTRNSIGILKELTT